MSTLKQVGDSIRGNLGVAQAVGALPRVRYNVRVSNTRKTGPAVNITIEGHERLIGDVENKATRDAWFASEGQQLKAAVDMCARRNDWDPPLGGVTKFGMLVISARVTGVSHVSSTS
jgi:hypothetical protein